MKDPEHMLTMERVENFVRFAAPELDGVPVGNAQGATIGEGPMRLTLAAMRFVQACDSVGVHEVLRREDIRAMLTAAGFDMPGVPSGVEA